MKRFDFQQYRNFSPVTKTLVRYLIYTIIVVLFFFWMKNSPQKLGLETTEEVEVPIEFLLE